MAENAQKPSPNQAVERKIESLTEELSGLINEAGTDGREEMRDYAVSLLQGGTETTVQETTTDEVSDKPAAPFSPVALSIPFLVVGIILLPLFAPIGLLMILLATIMGVGGWLALMLRRK